jgi:hypothetical protein
MGIEPTIIAGQRPATDVTKNRQLFALLYSDLRRLAERQLRSQECFGILCTLESTKQKVAFLDPLWIWA